MKQFEIHGGVKKQIEEYLNTKKIDLKTAMENEQSNHEVAAIVHQGLPAMVRKIYSLEKMQQFFWTKKELMVEFVAARLASSENKKSNEKKKR